MLLLTGQFTNKTLHTNCYVCNIKTEIIYLYLLGSFVEFNKLNYLVLI